MHLGRMLLAMLVCGSCLVSEESLLAAENVGAKTYPTPVPPRGTPQTMWELERLSRPPETFPVTTAPFDAMSGEAVRPLMYAGEPYRGRPTRVFAWMGFPANASPASPVPGIVLVHGGGGTAFRTWVRTWNERGYAAIAMDTCGHLPLPLDTDSKPWPTHEWSGPAGWGGFASVGDDPHDQWTYHAVAAVILGHSLLRAQPQVDATRIGITGISWGGYLTNIVAGVDTRLRFAVPVYGCGFIGEGSAWSLRNLGDDQAQRWVRLWDPAMYVGAATMPMLFCNGTNDRFYRPPIWHRTTLLPQGPVTRAYKMRMPHGHGAAGDPPEIRAFADALCRNATPLPSWTSLRVDGRRLTATIRAHSAAPITATCLVFTTGREPWPDRHWQAIPAHLDPQTGTVTATAPADAQAAYLDATDQRGLLTSSELAFLAK